MNTSKNVGKKTRKQERTKMASYIGKKTRKNKNDIKKNLDKWIINGNKNANKDIEEKM